MIFNNYYRLCIILFTDFKDPHPTSHVHINNNPTKTKQKDTKQQHDSIYLLL